MYTEYFSRYYPPSVENLEVLENDISSSTDLLLPTTLEGVISGLSVIVDWCNDQIPARRYEGQIYESVIINAFERLSRVRATLDANSGLHYNS